MKQILATLLGLVVTAFGLAQSTRPATAPPNGSMPGPVSAPATPAQQPQMGAPPQSAEAAVIPVQLAKSLDARKLKQGDPVEARITADLRAGDGTVIPRGSKVMGHVTTATARAKGDSQSQLGLSFDQIAVKSGKELPLKATIQAVGPPPSYGGPALNNEPVVPGAASPGPIGTGNPPAGLGAPSSNFPSNPSPGTAPPPGNQQSVSQITPQSTGVVGLHDLQLEQGSILASSGKDVKLDAGSQILLRVQSQ